MRGLCEDFARFRDDLARIWRGFGEGYTRGITRFGEGYARNNEDLVGFREDLAMICDDLARNVEVSRGLCDDWRGFARTWR